MNNLNINSSASETWQKEYDWYLQEAEKKRAENEPSDILLEQVRGGNEEAIDKLVDSSEVYIMNIIKQYPSDKVSINEMFEAGRNEVTKLAKQELNSPISSKFHGSISWCITQAIKKLIIDQSN